MAVKIKLKRLGKIRAPFYRVVVADSRTKRDGRAIEEIGKYHPTHDPSVIEIDTERAQHWLKVGAQPTEAVMALLKVTGDWQKFKGLPGAEGTLRVAEPRVRQGGVEFVATGLDAPAARAAKAKKDEAPAAAAAPAEAAVPAEAPAEAAVPVEVAAEAAAVAENVAPAEESAPADPAATETES
ncbi:MAG TPA: 30S ribosomal protein S16 [Sporichthyaceae bacterium]|nr:30S ribosomal protein S16 [Sporichthyaceae bacterium]